jgi:DNA-binding response OmpR family regulator
MKKPLALIVEDDLDLSDIFAQALQAAKFETEIIRDGRVALTRLADTQPAMVILDLHLPHTSGETILHHIRTDTRLAKTRVILTTADPALAEICRADADLVLIKPISFSQLRDLAIRLRPPNTL